MIKAIADTHTIIWYLYNDLRLSVTAKAFFNTTESEGNQIGLATISLAEIVYLVEKRRVPDDAFEEVVNLLKLQGSLLTEVVFTRQIAATMPRIERRKVPELPDRIITATALYRRVPVISRDFSITGSGVATIW